MFFLQDYLRECKKYLIKKGIDSPELSAEIIFAHCLKISRLDVLISKQTLTKQQIAEIHKLIVRRGEGEPLAYLIGKKEFYGYNFIVNKDVLIPRPCTETIIDLCKRLYLSDEVVMFSDVGTGCGNIAITLALEFNNFKGIALDISERALKVARLNLLNYNLMDRIILARSDLISCIKERTLDLIVSNPPYLSKELLNRASLEVINFEPINALFGGEKGLEIPKIIFDQARYSLKVGGRILMELDISQFGEITEYLHSVGCWENISVYKDLEGLNRVVCAQLV